MKERKHGSTVAVASAKAGMSRQTGSKYLGADKLPSELKGERHWRTRENPFEEVWPQIEVMLRESPDLYASTIFDALCDSHPGRFEEGQLRTLQRHIHRWRALSDADKNYEVFFPQRHRPGEYAQTDFTYTPELKMTLHGEPFEPVLCHVVLPYSNWQWVTRCISESFSGLKKGVQAAFFKLGKVPLFHQTDNSTGANHCVEKGKRKRAFNDDYIDFMNHLGMKPNAISPGQKEQNGTVEAQNGALKRLLNQQLLLRDSRDFESGVDFDAWLNAVVEKANGKRTKRLQEELSMMRPLKARRMPEFKEETVGVTRNSTICIKENIYSVPPRLIHHNVKVRIYEDRLEVFYADQKVQSMPRLTGRRKHTIDYRHVIWSLVKKPRAFERYVFRESLFPSLIFRRAYQALSDEIGGVDADRCYLRLLHQGATHLECEVASAIEHLLKNGVTPHPDEVMRLIAPKTPQPPKMDSLKVDLKEFDELCPKELVL